MKNILPRDLLLVLKLLKSKKIKNFDKRIPAILLHLIYAFFWNILYLAKHLANFRGQKKVKIKDFNLACMYFKGKLKKNYRSSGRKISFDFQNNNQHSRESKKIKSSFCDKIQYSRSHNVRIV